MKRISLNRLKLLCALAMLCVVLPSHAGAKQKTEKIQWQTLTEQQQVILLRKQVKWDQLSAKKQQRLLAMAERRLTTAEHRESLLQQHTQPTDERKEKLRESLEKMPVEIRLTEQSDGYYDRQPVNNKLDSYQRVSSQTAAGYKRDVRPVSDVENYQERQQYRQQRAVLREQLKALSPEERREFMQEYKQARTESRQQRKDQRK